MINIMGTKFLQDIDLYYLLSFTPNRLKCGKETAQSSQGPAALAIFIKSVCKSQKEQLFK